MGCINGIDKIKVLSEDGNTSASFQELLDKYSGDKDLAYKEYLDSLSDIKYQKINTTQDDILIDSAFQSLDDIDTSRIDSIKDLVDRQLKAFTARERELERSIEGLKPIDKSIRQDTINRIKKLREDINNQETKEAFINLISYAKNELSKTKNWLENRFDADKEVHRDTLFALSKQLDTYAGLVVPHYANKNSDLQNEIIEINSLYTDLKDIVPNKITDVWSKIILDKSKNEKFATKDDILEYLKHSEDIDLGQALLTDLSSSTDTVLALVDKIYKEKMEEVHDEVQLLKEQALEEGRLLVDAGFKDQDFMLEKDDKGNNTGNIVQRTSAEWKKKKQEVLSILEDKLVDENGMKTRRKYILKPNEELTEEDKQHNKDLASDKKIVGRFLRAEQWDKESKKLIDGDNQRYTNSFKNARSQYENYENGKWVKKKSIDEKKYERYIRKYYKDPIESYVADKDEEGNLTGTVHLETFRWPKDEYIETTDEWNSDIYNEIMKDPATRRFYEFYTEKFMELMNRLPADVAKKMDGRVFRIKDEFLHQLSEKKTPVIKRVLKYLKEMLLPNIITNGRLLDEKGYPTNDVGIFYVGDLRSDNRIVMLEKEIADIGNNPSLTAKKQLAKLKNSLAIEKAKLTPDMIKYDLVESLIQGGHMAINYHTMKSVESTFQMAREVLANKKYYKTDKFGDPIMDKDGNIEYKDEESRALKRLDTFMRMIFYNNSQANNNTAGKLAVIFKNYVSIKLQGLNVFSGFNNVITAEVNQIIEARGGRFYNKEQYRRANTIMTSHISEMKWLSNMFKQTDKYHEEIPYNKLTAMVEKFNFLEENADRGVGIKTKQTVGQYVKSFNWMFAFIEGGEYQAQVRSAIAKMMNTEVEMSDGSKSNVWDAYDFIGGKLVLKEGSKFTPKDRINVTGQIKNMNKYIHGNHSSIDKVALQETWYGELVLQFKRWMPNNFRSRFSKQYVDESLNMEMEGRYRALIPFFNNMMVNGYKYKLAMEGLNELEQANMKKNMAEIAMFGIALALYIIFDSIRDRLPPDDEKTRMALNFLKRQADRSMGEIDAFINPLQFYSQLKNPVAGLRIIEEVGQFMSQIFNIPFQLIQGDPEKLIYEKGVNKGEYKIVKEGRDLIPGATSIAQYRQLAINGNFFIK